MIVLLLSFAKLGIGLALLVVGAEFLTDNCIIIARRLGVSPMIIGLTVVAFGTSAPEFFVTVMANIRGQADLAVGNIIGSNIANIGLVLAAAAIIQPFPIHRRIARVELPFLVMSVILMGLAAWFEVLSRPEAVILLTSFCVYLYFLVENRTSYSQPALTVEKTCHKNPQLMVRFIIIALSFIALISGSHLLIQGAVSIARFFNCPELIIGLSLTAVGTSLPELASTISAIRRREAGLVIGNVLGSNFANTCGVLGIAALIRPIPINHHVLVVDLPIMAALSLVLIPLFKDGYLSRKDGFLLLFAYLSYISIIYLKM